MPLPVRPPIEPMLAKQQDDVPDGAGWLYEPKWDGFRAIVFRDGDAIHLGSRGLRELSRFFPELLDTLRAALPPRCVVDGEIVIETPGGLDFEALQMRLHPAASRVARLAAETPSSFIPFDLLAIDDEDLRERPLDERRSRLAAVVPLPDDPDAVGVIRPGEQARSRVALCPQTADVARARAWLQGLGRRGFDGVIAKRVEQPYRPGERVMVKVKKIRTADCVVGGFRLNEKQDGVASLLLGLFDTDGRLLHVGHTSGFKAKERREILARLQPLAGKPSFAAGHAPGGPSRWNQGKEKEWTPVEPVLVCEVSYDHLQGDRFRHATGFVRWREDKPAAQCTLDQLRF